MKSGAVATVVAFTLTLAACGSPPAPSVSPAPVAQVGGETVTRQALDLRVHSAMTAIEQGGAAATGAGATAMAARVRASVMRSLIIDAEIAHEARARGIAAGDGEVEREIQADASADGGTAGLATELTSAGGSLDQLRDEIRSRLNESRLEDAFARERAAAAAATLASGVAFATVARDYSDDTTSAARGGDVGSVASAILTGGDPLLAAAVGGLAVGARPSAPVRDRAGYEILQVDSRTPAGTRFHRILVAAPDPYTVKERPAWFAQAVFAALAADCARGAVRVYIDPGTQPCASASSPLPAG